MEQKTGADRRERNRQDNASEEYPWTDSTALPAVWSRVITWSIGYFEQEMPPDIDTTCLEEIWQEFPSYTQYEVRSALAKCGLTTKHIESKVRVLSGGEQAKAASVQADGTGE